MQHKNIVRIALGTLFLLLLPLLAMQFTDTVAWGVGDFVLAGALLFGTGLLYEVIAKRARASTYRLAVVLALAAAFILIWGNLALGLIGSEDNPANRMYIGVLAVGIIGAFLARLKPQGMARALFATALAQALVAVIALVGGLGSPGSGRLEILLLNGFFIVLFVGSALLFRRASATGS